MGIQEPRIGTWPDGDEAIGQLAVRWFRDFGLTYFPWQNFTQTKMLRGGVRGAKWSAPTVCIVCTRQQGKSWVLVGRMLFGLFQLPWERTIIFTAHLFATAREIFRDVLGIIDSHPELKSRVKRVTTGAGHEGIELKDGSRIRFLARSKDSARGWQADLIVCDEAYAMTADEVAALRPTTTQAVNPQFIYASSAGMDSSDVLRNLREKGIEGSPGLAYFEWSAEDDAQNDDLDAIRQANPSLGYSNQTLDDVLTDLQDLTEDRYRRERLGIWSPVAAENAVPAGAWEDCRDLEWPESVQLSRVAIGVDVPPDRSSATVAVAGVREGESEVSVELFQQAEGTDWVAPVLRELLDARGRVPVLVDGSSAAAALEADFRAHRVRAQFLSTRVYAQACGAFFDAVVNGRLRHRGQRDLDRAVGVAGQSMKGAGLWVWKRPDSTHNIAPLCAATLAVHGCLNRRDSGQSRAGRRRAVVL